MDVVLEGASPAALTAGILLLTRARSFGIPGVRVSIVGDPAEITPVLGPAVLHSTVLATCGVGRELGRGALVVVPGSSREPLLVSLAAEGDGPWFQVDTSGRGAHPATQAFVRLCRDDRPDARQLGRDLRGLLALLGVPSEPAILDLLFAAPTDPLTRVALALRAGRSVTGRSGESITRMMAGDAELPDPLSNCSGEDVLRWHAEARLEPFLDRVSITGRDLVEDFLEVMASLAAQDNGRDLALVGALAELLSHLAALPPHGMIPPLLANADAVATGLGRALGATQGEQDAARTLAQVYRMVGGRFVDEETHPIRLMNEPAPEARLERWQWFTRGVNDAAAQADDLWRQVMDPAS